MTACNEYTELDRLTFVGDSLVARWDLGASFPTTRVRNLGVSGSGIEYLESLSGRLSGEPVVVISGTNDVYALKADPEALIPQYASDYLSAIAALGATEVYLYSIFPRGENFQGGELNPIILKLNEAVRQKISEEYPHFHYIQVYDALEYKGYLAPQYTADGLHLNVFGYELITQALIDNLSK